VQAGEAFSPRQADHVRHALALARSQTGLHFSVYVGSADRDVREFAQRLHAALGDDAASAVVVFVEPVARRVEIVTGEIARRRVDDRAAGLASLSMATSFAGGDLVGGIVNGVRMLAQSAERPRVLHEHDAD